MRYLLTISYDGSKYFGFQRLKNKSTVQSSIEEAIKKVFKEGIEIKGAGRTDRGVHAYGQRCHFDLKREIAPEKLKNALNDQLKPYIYITDCKTVDDDFHARFNVKEKEYVYKINMGDYNPTLEDYAMQISYPLNIRKMKKCSKEFIGVHDYSSFVSGSRDNSTAIIYDIKFIQYGDLLYITFRGKSFYRYMIRNLVGALIEVGKEKANIEDIKATLNNDSTDVKFPTAKSNGLYLMSIKY